jgi:hypothetical protein
MIIHTQTECRQNDSVDEHGEHFSYITMRVSDCGLRGTFTNIVSCVVVGPDDKAVAGDCRHSDTTVVGILTTRAKTHELARPKLYPPRYIK